MTEDRIVVTRGDGRNLVWSSLTGWHDGKRRYILRRLELELLFWGALAIGVMIGAVAALSIMK